MDIEKEIKQNGFKSVAEFARVLGAPVRTFYAYIKNRRKPKDWQFRAFINAAVYKSRSVDGWKCRNCGSVVESSNSDGRKPSFCGGCGQKYFNPVRIVHDPEPNVEISGRKGGEL